MERNVTLDYFKIFLSILVITIHMIPLFSKDSIAGWLISNGLARMAVPCFFILNGYFFVSKIENSKLIKKYLIHLLTIYSVWTLIYAQFYFNKDYMTPFRYFEYIFSGFDHLWYVTGLMLGILLLLLARRFIKNDKTILIIGIVLFVVGYLLEPTRISLIQFRNGIYIGFPFITMGYYIHKNNLIEKIKDSYLIPTIVIGFVALLVDSYFAQKASITRDFYLALLILCPALLIFIFKHSKYKTGGVYLTYLGSMASAIYFVHDYFVRILTNYAVEEYNIKIFPLVLLFSVIASVIIIFVNKRIKIFL